MRLPVFLYIELWSTPKLKRYHKKYARWMEDLEVYVWHMNGDRVMIANHLD